VFTKGLQFNVCRIDRSIAGEVRVVRAFLGTWLLTYCYGLAERGETATVRQEQAGCGSR